jgi:hypothetical protein
MSIDIKELKFPPRAHIIILGPRCCGKTTLINVLKTYNSCLVFDDIVGDKFKWPSGQLEKSAIASFQYMRDIRTIDFHECNFILVSNAVSERDKLLKYNIKVPDGLPKYSFAFYKMYNKDPYAGYVKL